MLIGLKNIKMLTLKKALKLQGKKIAIASLVLSVAMGILFILINIRHSMEKTALSLAYEGRNSLDNIQRELGFKDEVGLEHTFRYIENRFGLKFQYRGDTFDFTQCVVHRQFEDMNHRVDLCASSLLEFSLVKKLTTPRGDFFVVFSKKIGFNFLKDIAPFIFVIMSCFALLFIVGFNQVMRLSIRPLTELHAYMLNASSRPTPEIKELADVLYLIDTSRDAVENQAIANTVGSIIHDVSKPFSMLANSLDQISKLSGSELETYIKEVTPQLKNAVESTTWMLHDLENVAGPIKLILKEIDVKALVDSATSCFSLNKRMTCTFNHTSVLRADETKILRALVNLLSNVWDILRIKENAKAWIVTREDFSYIEIIVGNSESHIQEDKLKSVFDKFYTAGKQNGRGLGLAITKKYVEAHGGSILASSNNNQVEFTIRLPKV